jgi:hypothetical protein
MNPNIPLDVIQQRIKMLNLFLFILFLHEKTTQIGGVYEENTILVLEKIIYCYISP